LRLLERLGYSADLAGNGREALARLEAASYDVVLMDVQMPEMDGLEASRAICARWPANQRPRIVAMTAEAMLGDREKCLAAGMEDYLVKPVTLDRLAAALARCSPMARTTTSDVGAGTEAAGDVGRTAARLVLDRKVLDQLRDDLGAAPVREVILTFLQKTPAVPSTLRAAATRADVESLRRAAHMIKGTSATLGGQALSEQCADLERLVDTATTPDVAARVAVIEASYRSVEAALRAEAGL